MKRIARGDVAIVTGGGSGIGRALSLELAKRGADVVVADRDAPAARQVAAEIEALGRRAAAAELDVRDHDAFARLASETRRSAGRIDYLFNNAGIAIGSELADYEREDWESSSTSTCAA